MRLYLLGVATPILALWALVFWDEWATRKERRRGWKGGPRWAY